MQNFKKLSLNCGFRPSEKKNTEKKLRLSIHYYPYKKPIGEKLGEKNSFHFSIFFGGGVF